MEISRALAPSLFILLFSACASIGSKEAFVLDPASPWKMSRTGSEDRYTFSCNGMWVDVSEIVVTYQTSAFGPIVPIIPSGNKRSLAHDHLNVRVTAAGTPPAGISSPEGSQIVAISSGEELRITYDRVGTVSSTKRPNGDLWFQYGMLFSYDKRLGEIEKLELQFRLPIFPCEVPNLRLARKWIPNNEFIVTPGV